MRRGLGWLSIPQNPQGRLALAHGEGLRQLSQLRRAALDLQTMDPEHTKWPATLSTLHTPRWLVERVCVPGRLL